MRRTNLTGSLPHWVREWGVGDFEARVNLKVQAGPAGKPASYWAEKICVELGFKYGRIPKIR